MSLFHSYFSLIYIIYTFQTAVHGDVFTGTEKNCSCGFYDAVTGNLFTDSIIIYFNETNHLPLDSFLPEDYENVYEKDWNAIYVQGADPSNLRTNGSETLELRVSPPMKHHLVQGAGLRTTRRDIQHGSFRALIKSPPKEAGGSAMSMMWKYNESEVTELSIMNTDSAAEAWVGTFVNDEFTTRDLGVNYSRLLVNSSTNRNYLVLAGDNGSVNPFQFTEYRIDWTEDAIDFYIGGNCTRTVLHKEHKNMPSVPAPFFFKHWSVGNKYSMQGPPSHGSVAEIGWIRMFFNSSLTDTEKRTDFVGRCPLSDACSMDDASLRGSSSHSEKATLRWKQVTSRSTKRMPAVWMSVMCIVFSAILLFHAFIRRTPWRRHSVGSGLASTHSAQHGEGRRTGQGISIERSSNGAGSSPVAPSARPSSDCGPRWTDDLVIEKADPSPESSKPASLLWDSRATTPGVTPYGSGFNTTVEELPSPKELHGRVTCNREDGTLMSQSTIAVLPPGDDKIRMTTVTESQLPAPRMTAHPPPPRQRIDYLAGLVAICAVLVSIMHFGLSYIPALVIPGAPIHYQSEYWAQKVISPFILNQMWLGVFFTTSTRFLVSKYLRTGDLKDVAQAAVRRTPRLMIPVATVALFEYFLIDVGVTKYLQYVPSISWSTWPYVNKFPSFGHYISEVLELIYLVPNAVPQITFNYCTGVLWTIAVQLQGSWLVLVGVIVVRELKKPWKRFSYYTFCVLVHWYAQSWGSYLWFGLVLADLDITYKYRPWLHARTWLYYPLVTFFWICVALGFSANVAPNWSDFDFSTLENNIHPNWSSGDPILSTGATGYPAYYVPRLNGLLFAVGMQAIVEISPAVQWFLSLKPFLILFPHIFTIYLLHGLVFWSWGSWLMVSLADRGFVYGVNVAIVGLSSYGVLCLCLPIVTPIIEALGKDVTALVWMAAVEKSPPRRRTLFPFPEDLLANRTEKVAVADVESGRNWNLSNGSTAENNEKISYEKGFGRREKEVEA